MTRTERRLVLLAIFVVTAALIVVADIFGFLGLLLASGETVGVEATAGNAAVVFMLAAPWVISLFGAACAWLINRSNLPHAARRDKIVVWVSIVVIALTPLELVGLVYTGVRSSSRIAAVLDVVWPGWNDVDEDWKRLQHVGQFENELAGDPPLEGRSDTIYVSIPDTDPNCSHAGLPPLPAPGRYHCVRVEQLGEHDGAGWLPWGTAEPGAQHAPSRSGPPLVDPRNRPARGLYYRFRMLSPKLWSLTVPMARADDIPSGNPPPLDRSMQLRHSGAVFVLSGTRHTRR